MVTRSKHLTYYSPAMHLVQTNAHPTAIDTRKLGEIRPRKPAWPAMHRVQTKRLSHRGALLASLFLFCSPPGLSCISSKEPKKTFIPPPTCAFCITFFLCSRRVWTAEEDAAIRTLVKTHGMRSWAIIEEYLASEYSIFGRSGKQCRERWHNHLGKRAVLLFTLVVRW